MRRFNSLPIRASFLIGSCQLVSHALLLRIVKVEKCRDAEAEVKKKD